MHEVGIVQNLIDHAVRAAAGRPIKQIHVALGELADLSPEALHFYFDELRTGTLAAGARLVVRVEPCRAQCPLCGREFVIDSECAACPECGSLRLKVTAGDRLALEAVDVA